MLRQIEAAVEDLQRDGSLSGAVICGMEQCFAAGADLEEIRALDGVKARQFAELGQRVMLAVENSKKPVIAAVRGYCFGGAFDLALACCARIASEDAIFGHRGAALGIITGWGGTQRLSRVLGPRGKALALELMTAGRTVDAREARQRGLVREILGGERLLDAACELASGAIDEP